MTDPVVKMRGVHPLLIAAVLRILDAMRTLGHPMMVTDALRTDEEQQILYAKGRSAPGDIVTYKDGVNKRSNHQPHADGFGYAVDLAFLDADGHPTWDVKNNPWYLYGAMAKSQGLVWGGTWTTLVDLPHIEMPEDHPVLKGTQHA